MLELPTHIFHWCPRKIDIVHRRPILIHIFSKIVSTVSQKYCFNVWVNQFNWSWKRYILLTLCTREDIIVSFHFSCGFLTLQFVIQRWNGLSKIRHSHVNSFMMDGFSDTEKSLFPHPTCLSSHRPLNISEVDKKNFLWIEFLVRKKVIVHLLNFF